VALSVTDVLPLVLMLKAPWRLCGLRSKRSEADA
jgi:hypothetical protein